MNAKSELLDIVKSKNLTILKIDCVKLAPISFEEKDHIRDLDSLDFEYYEGYGIQELYGKVYCKDSKGNPVWLTRGEYDGSEWWEINTIPEYYTDNSIQ